MDQKMTAKQYSKCLEKKILLIIYGAHVRNIALYFGKVV
jgi:hypothetical protein